MRPLATRKDDDEGGEHTEIKNEGEVRSGGEADKRAHEETIVETENHDPTSFDSNDVLGLIFEAKGQFRKVGALESNFVFWYFWEARALVFLLAAPLGLRQSFWDIEL